MDTNTELNRVRLTKKDRRTDLRRRSLQLRATAGCVSARGTHSTSRIATFCCAGTRVRPVADEFRSDKLDRRSESFRRDDEAVSFQSIGEILRSRFRFLATSSHALEGGDRDEGLEVPLVHQKGVRIDDFDAV